MKRFFIPIIVAAGYFNLPAQTNSESGLAISGYTRATGFLGMISQETPTLKSLYSETSLKLKAKTGQWGQAYTDIRFRVGTEYGTDISFLDIREAYIDLYLGKIDLRLGKQISPWGRADGWNPSDNMTPSDYFFRSPDPDDMRMGNYRIRAQYAPVDWLRIEADLVPLHKSSVYRFDLVEMPSFVSFESPVSPGFIWGKTSAAAKLDLISNGIEGSLSYFRGYDPLPALKPGALPTPPFTDFSLELLQVPFRQRTIGADFATVLLSTGIRGEIAWKVPEQGDSLDPMIPKSEIQWVVSIDRELGPVRIIAGYLGKKVDNFVPAAPPQDFDPAMISNPEIWPLLGPMLADQIGYYNRILFDQTHEWNHSALFRSSVTLLHENLGADVSFLYNLTTEEYLFYPKVTYQVNDGLQATAGYQYYHGEKYTRFSWIKHVFNGPFFELRLTF